jgi:hypothetical protein
MQKRGHVTTRNREMMEKRAAKNFLIMNNRIIQGIKVAYAYPESKICTQFEESDG